MKQAHKTYGYCRISTPQQRITRQVGNIKAGYPDAIIVEEVFTGTTTDRPAFGRAPGSKIETKKAKKSKEVIRKHSKDFGGSLTDPECIRLVGIARGTYYKYKKEIRAEQAAQD